MKRVCFFSLSVFFVYVAGMYRYPALMVLAVGQLLLLLFLTVQTSLCIRRVQVGFRRKLLTAVKGEAVSGEIRADYDGKLPAGRLCFSIRYGYGGGTKKKKVRRLYGNAGGINAFSMVPAFCGMAELCLEECKVYDFFSLGFGKRELSDNLRMMVFPKERELSLCFQHAAEEGAREEYATAGPGMPGNDRLRQIRDYREGDLVKSLHWKLSARADRLLVREYEREAKGQAELLLDLNGYGEAGPKEKDAFYELVSALLLGLLRNRDSVRVHWRGEHTNEEAMNVTVPAQCRALLARLYLLSGADGEELSPSGTGEKALPGGGWSAERERTCATGCRECFLLDMRLRLSVDGRQLFGFSAEKLEEELQRVRILV